VGRRDELPGDALIGVHVLVVDDDADARDLITTVLEYCGALVTGVASASAALETLGRVTPDVVLADVSLPNRDGYWLIQQLRALPHDRGGALAVLRARALGPLFVGGHSYGGRQASMLAAEQPDLITGLLLSSYPLHPPRRAAASRSEHFPALRCPVLFVHGTRDAFATVEELESARRRIVAPTSLVPVEGAGHDLVRTGSATALARVVVEAFLDLVK
jgi:pimeloyl-ACP methyl ester carboxylesterase